MLTCQSGSKTSKTTKRSPGLGTHCHSPSMQAGIAAPKNLVFQSGSATRYKDCEICIDRSWSISAINPADTACQNSISISYYLTIGALLCPHVGLPAHPCAAYTTWGSNRLQTWSVVTRHAGWLPVIFFGGFIARLGSVVSSAESDVYKCKKLLWVFCS